MNAGQLRQIIDIEQPTEPRESSGAITLAPWSLFATVRAEIKPVSGTESFVGSEFLGQKTHDIEIRYLPGLTSKMRVNFKTDAQRQAGKDGRLFDILDV